MSLLAEGQRAAWELPKKSCSFANLLACARIFVHTENDIKMACRLHVVCAYWGKFYSKIRKRLLGSPRHRQNRNITVDLKEVLQRLYEKVLSGPVWGPLMVAQWFRYCATNRKVAGSIPDGVTGIFH
jgi:hypothetical protein